MLTRTLKPDHTRAAPANEFSWLRALTSLDTQGGMRPTSRFEREFDTKARSAFTGLDTRGFFAPWSSIRAAHTAGSFTTGGALIQEKVSEVAAALRPSSFVVQAGAQVIDASGALIFPRFSTAIGATWVAETGAVPSVDTALAEMSLAPRAVGCSITLSAQLLQQVDGVEEFIRKELRAALGEALDRAVCVGSGGVEPAGITTTSGVGRDVVFSGPADWADVLTFESELGQDSVEDLGSHRFVMSHQTRARWKSKEKAPGSGFLIEGATCNSYPVIASRFMEDAGHKVIFGGFGEVYVASFGPGVQVVVDPYTDATTRRVKLTAFAMLDVGIRRPTTFQVSVDAGNQ